MILEIGRIWLPEKQGYLPRYEARNDSNFADTQNIPVGYFDERIVGRRYYDNEPKRCVYGAFALTPGPRTVRLNGLFYPAVPRATAIRIQYAFLEFIVRQGIKPKECDMLVGLWAN